MGFEAHYLWNKSPLYARMCRRLSKIRPNVLTGEKLQRALYPSREALLAEANGMSVTIAREKWTIVKIRCVDDFLLFILNSYLEPIFHSSS